MIFMLNACLRLGLLLTAILLGNQALERFRGILQQFKAARLHEEHVAICSQLLANVANINDATRFLSGALPGERNHLYSARARILASLDEHAASLDCPYDASATLLQAGKRRTRHPDLPTQWPNWVAAYQLRAGSTVTMPNLAEGDE